MYISPRDEIRGKSVGAIHTRVQKLSSTNYTQRKFSLGMNSTHKHILGSLLGVSSSTVKYHTT